jgi:hypothetical protein
METEEKNKQVNLEGLMVGEVELPKLDVNPYLSKKVKVASVEVQQGNYGYYYVLKTDIIDVIKNADGSGFELRASKLLGLTTLPDGKVGWGSKSKTAAFLKQYKVKTPEEMKGKTVTLIPMYNVDKDTTFLTF